MTPASPATSPPTTDTPTLGAMVLDSARRHSGVALEYTRAGRPAYISYPELGTISSEIARGLISLGIEAGDRVAILGLTSAEWTLAECGALCAGTVVTPIYHTNSPEECAYVLEHSGARLIFCENGTQAAKIAAVRERLPELEHLVMLDGDSGVGMSLDELRRVGSEIPPEAVDERLLQVAPDDVATLVYTSGTTGPPKGCMLTHENFLATTHMYAEQLGFREQHTMYQFLPLAHVLARIAEAVALTVGARVIYWGGDPTKILDEVAARGPTHFPAVPRIYEKIHAAVLGRMDDGPAAQRALFTWALRTGKHARPSLRAGRLPSLRDDLEFRIADQLVLRKVRKLFGENLVMAMVGAAPIARDLLEFFDACGVLVLEGYGLTESCAAATVNTLDAVQLGSVGRPLPGTEVAIAPDGEVLLRGPHVFKGYHRDPEATAAALTPDGWLRTGDLGALDGEGFLHITGRKKDLIITSSGKNITPTNIESLLRESRYIAEAVVFGDNRPYLVAIVTLEPEEAAKLAAQPDLHAVIQAEIEAVNAKLARIEQVKRFAILEHDFSQAGGELTPTLKIKRAAIYAKYADVFDALYEQETQS